MHYENLNGSTGRRAFSRPKRFNAVEVFPQPVPRVHIAGKTVWQLSDISLGGIAVTSNQIFESPVDIGDRVSVRLDQAGFPLLEAVATVRRAEPSGMGSKLALQFTDDFIDIPALRSKDAQARMRLHVATLRAGRNDMVPAEYRVLCSDVLETLRSYRSFLKQRSDLVETDKDGSCDNTAAYELCLEQIMPQWRDLWLRGNAITESVIDDKQRLDALKNLTELVVTPEFCQGPIWERSYKKPLGYPGDYQVMNYVYDWKREGETTYDQLVHRLGLDVAECIGTRMDVVIGTILKAATAKPPREPMRVLSLGSGPAREVSQIFETTGSGETPFEYTLIDQEEQALQFAYEGNTRAAKAHHAGAAIRCLNLSFTDILRGDFAIGSVCHQDVVYSVGLLDYLKDRRARGLARSMFQMVRPGGLMILGNMNKTELSNLWPMEVITDWRLYYRSDADMLGWADDLDKQAAWTECDPTGRVRLLFVRKSEE